MAIPTPYSYRQYTGDGSAKDFSVPFPYLQRDHVHVYLDGKELVAGTDFNWTSGTQIKLNIAPQAAVTGATAKPAEVLTVRRLTPENDQIVQWNDGSYIIQDDLNESDRQWLYLIQEHHDWLLRHEAGFGALPGDGAHTGPVSQFWNRLARHLDPDKGTANESAQTVDTQDQKAPTPTGLASAGWIADDKHVATTGAISERLDPIVSDTKPSDPPIGEYRQIGKFWIDNGALQISYWEPAAGAWVNLAGTGPRGPAGSVAVGTTTTLVPGSAATVANSGTGSAAVLNFGIPRGDPGPAGPVGPIGPTGVAPSVVGHAPITATRSGSDVDLTFDPIPLTHLP
jgi:hypothetical protein